MEKQKNIPQLRFPEFKGVGEKKTVGDLGKFTGGGTPDTTITKYWNGNVPWISSSDIQDDTVQEYLTSRFITDEAIKKSATKLIPQNSILIVSRVGIGKFAVSKSPVCTSQDFTNLTPLVDNPYFLAYYFKEKTKLFLRFSQGTSIKGFTGSDIRNIVFLIPTLPEQQKIASFFTAIDQKIFQLKRKKTLLEEYKKGVMQKIFSQEIRFKDDNGQEFPKWEKKRLGSILNERNIQVPKSDEYPLMAFVANKGVAHKGERYNREFLVNDGDNKKYKQTEYGDFIYSSNNLETGSIGLNSFGSASISPVYSIFQIDESCNPQFLGCYFVRKSFINKMTSYRQGVVYGQWRIHESDFLKIEEWIPSTTEQTKIANFLSAIDDKINHTQKQVEKAEVWKKGLMQQMFC